MARSDRNDDALERFYSDTSSRIRAYILRHCSDKDSVDDLFQITYVKFLGSRMARTADAPEARAYLYRIASNVIADHGRTLQRQRRFENSEREPAAAERRVPIEESAALRDALRSLSAREQQLLWLLYAEGFSHKEVASTMKMQSGSVRVLAFRVRKKLAELLEPTQPDSKDGRS